MNCPTPKYSIGASVWLATTRHEAGFKRLKRPGRFFCHGALETIFGKVPMNLWVKVVK